MSDGHVHPLARPKLHEASSGLIVIRDEMTAEDRRQRRADNKLAAKSRALHRKRKPHGRH